MILNSPYISGSLTVTGNTTIQGQLTVTGSLSGTASLASNALLLQGTGSTGFATTASINEVSASQQSISASLLQVSASYIALSGSYNTFSGSASTRITENSSSIQQVSSSLLQVSASLLNVVANYATTGSNSFRANQSITGSLVVSSTITAQTLVVQTVTSSIVYSSGSNNFGNQLANTQTFTGSVNITGSLTVNTTGTEFQVTNNGVVMGNVLTDNHSITGSLRVTGSNHSIFGNVLIGSTNAAGTERFGVTRDDGVTDGLHIIADFNRSGASSAELILGYYASGSAVTGPVVYASNSQPLLFAAGAQERMRITSAGNVGIGISSANAIGFTGPMLTIAGTGQGQGIEIWRNSNTIPDGEDLGLITFLAGTSPSQVARIVGKAVGTSENAGAISFQTSDGPGVIERMHIKSTGHIGINTASPVSTSLTGSITIYKYYNADQASVPSTTAQAYYGNQHGLYLFGRNSGLTIVSANSEEGSIKFGNASTNVYATIGTTTGTSAVGGDMIFRVGSDTERLRISGSGQIAIGTSSWHQPYTKLIVAGAIAYNNNSDAAVSDNSYGMSFAKKLNIVAGSGANTIYSAAGSEAALYVVTGLNLTTGSRFTDVVLYLGAGTTAPVVIASQIYSTSVTRTYTNSGETLTLSLTGNSNTYTIRMTGMGANERT